MKMRVQNNLLAPVFLTGFHWFWSAKGHLFCICNRADAGITSRLSLISNLKIFIDIFSPCVLLYKYWPVPRGIWQNRTPRSVILPDAKRRVIWQAEGSYSVIFPKALVYICFIIPKLIIIFTIYSSIMANWCPKSKIVIHFKALKQ